MIFVLLLIIGFLIVTYFLTKKTAHPIQQMLPIENIPANNVQGAIEPNWGSFSNGLKTSICFCEAKIDMWLHLRPQTVGEDSHWYAKWIYNPQLVRDNNIRFYINHLKRLEHTSEIGSYTHGSKTLSVFYINLT